MVELIFRTVEATAKRKRGPSPSELKKIREEEEERELRGKSILYHFWHWWFKYVIFPEKKEKR